MAGKDLAGKDLAGKDLAGKDLAGKDLAGKNRWRKGENEREEKMEDVTFSRERHPELSILEHGKGTKPIERGDSEHLSVT